MTPIIVELTEVECRMAEAAAQFFTDRVFDERLAAGHGEASRSYARRLEQGVLGAYGELAAAKHAGQYWDAGQNDFGTHGDGGGVEIRSTKHDGHLIVYPDDPSTRLIRLVIVRREEGGAKCRLAGQIRAAEAKCAIYTPPPGKLRPGSPPQWWVPQAALEEWK